MAEYLVQDTTLTAIADAVRAKKGTTDPIALTDFATEIESIESGGGSGSNKFALLVGKPSADNLYDITAKDLESVTEIRSYAFYGCKWLRNIDLSNVTSIGDHTFQYCDALTSVEMPKVTYMLSGAFFWCSNLQSVKMPLLTEINGEVFRNCTALTSVEMPNVTKIGTGAFQSCSALTSVEMPSVITISSGAFSFCRALSSVTIPNTCTEIKSEVFSTCESLTSLTIPSTCTKIGNFALQCGSSSNKCTFTFEGTTPPSIQYRTFDANLLNKIIVPQGCGDTYKTATTWSNWADYIVEATE